MAQPLSSKMDWPAANPIWAQALNPVLANAILSGRALNNVVLVSGVALTINHGLGRLMQGWFVTDMNAGVTIFRSQPLNSSTITLNASANVTINLWVY